MAIIHESIYNSLEDYNKTAPEAQAVLVRVGETKTIVQLVDEKIAEHLRGWTAAQANDEIDEVICLKPRDWPVSVESFKNRETYVGKKR
jgi:hypothetical protein